MSAATFSKWTLLFAVLMTAETASAQKVVAFELARGDSPTDRIPPVRCVTFSPCGKYLDAGVQIQEGIR